MRALLDTCVLSELRRPRPHPIVRRTVEGFDSSDLFVSVISVGEIAKGIALLADSPHKRALHLWLQTVERNYSDRILPVDIETSRIWGEIAAAAQKAGRPIGAIDALIAATARRHGLVVVTRNVADFEPTGVSLLNPWDE